MLRAEPYQRHPGHDPDATRRDDVVPLPHGFDREPVQADVSDQEHCCDRPRYQSRWDAFFSWPPSP